MKIPTEICDFMFEVLYSDGTPAEIKKSAFELIKYHDLQMGHIDTGRSLMVTLGGGQFEMPRDIAAKIDSHLSNNQKINAIKELRSWAFDNSYPSGLKECKDCIDTWKNWNLNG